MPKVQVSPRMTRISLPASFACREKVKFPRWKIPPNQDINIRIPKENLGFVGWAIKISNPSRCKADLCDFPAPQLASGVWNIKPHRIFGLQA
jgi:hypothetical protein